MERRRNSQRDSVDFVDHLGDVFSQLKIKKSSPLSSKGSRRRHGGGRAARGRNSSTADDCTEIFYRLNIIFPAGLRSSRRVRARPALFLFTYANSTLSTFFLALFNRAPCSRSDESSTRCRRVLPERFLARYRCASISRKRGPASFRSLFLPLLPTHASARAFPPRESFPTTAATR